MSLILTEGGASKLLQPKISGQAPVVLQAIGIRAISEPGADGKCKHLFVVLLSDGTHMIHGLLSDSLASLVAGGRLRLNGLLCVDDFHPPSVEHKGFVFIKTAMPLSEHPGKMLGSPQQVWPPPLTPPSTSNAPSQPVPAPSAPSVPPRRSIVSTPVPMSASQPSIPPFSTSPETLPAPTVATSKLPTSSTCSLALPNPTLPPKLEHSGDIAMDVTGTTTSLEQSDDIAVTNVISPRKSGKRPACEESSSPYSHSIVDLTKEEDSLNVRGKPLQGLTIPNFSKAPPQPVPAPSAPSVPLLESSALSSKVVPSSSVLLPSAPAPPASPEPIPTPTDSTSTLPTPTLVEQSVTIATDVTSSMNPEQSSTFAIESPMTSQPKHEKRPARVSTSPEARTLVDLTNEESSTEVPGTVPKESSQEQSAFLKKISKVSAAVSSKMARELGAFSAKASQESAADIFTRVAPLSASTAKVAYQETTPMLAMKELSVISEAADDFATELVLLGRTTFKIVGIRYYDGVARPGEFVHLVREPHNMYDKNAVRVENLRHTKVGHIKREAASLLAHLMDYKHDVLKVEASVLALGNQFELPATIELLGISSNPATKHKVMAQLIQELKVIFRQKLGYHYVSWFENGVATSPQAASLESLEQLPVAVERLVVDWQQEQEQLDAMFEKQMRDQMKNVPKIDMPKQFGSDVELYKHQKEGIRWLVHQESGNKPPPFFKQVTEKKKKVWLCEITMCSQQQQPLPVCGSILADEMGLGKTIQTIGLILLAPPPNHIYSRGARLYDTFDNKIDSKPKAVERKKPPSSLSLAAPSGPWEPPTEAALRKTKVADLNNVLKQAGLWRAGRKKAQVVELILAKVKEGVLLEQHFDPSARIIRPIAVGTGVANAKAVPRPIPLEVAGPPTLSQSSKGEGFCTLVVAPVSVLSSWAQQIHQHVKEGVLRVETYQGPGRQSLIPRIKKKQVDVLVVSYHTLANDYEQAFPFECNGAKDLVAPVVKKRRTETLFDIPFHRIVLDEAHMIRSSTTRFFKSVTKIDAERKLALTGTPFVNRPDDINSLFSFLNLEPLADKAIFARSVTTPIQAGNEIGLARLRTALAHVALRRSKAVADIKLVNKSVELRAISFPVGYDKEVYEAIYYTFRTAVHAVLMEGVAAVLKRYSCVLEVLLRMRQACCSAQLVSKQRREAAMDAWRELLKRDPSKPLTAEEGKDLMDKLAKALGAGGANTNEKAESCAVCLDPIVEDAAVILRNCSHVFCQTCISEVAKTPPPKCPMCRKVFQKSDMVKKEAAVVASRNIPEAKTETKQEATMSPKVSALLEAIEEMSPDEKGVIFSQFTSFLDLIAVALKSKGIESVRIQGNMNARQRGDSIAEFSKDRGPQFILCSLHAAGTGITLTRGNVVFMMDCWWNQSVENQAMDRVHRIGQLRDVRVMRFVMKDSIEERMVKIQETKNVQAKGAFNKLNEKEKKKVRLADLRKLFQIDHCDESSDDEDDDSPFS